MIFFIVALMALCFYKAKVFPPNTLFPDYLSKTNTSAIRGAFMLLIIATHYAQYVKLDGIYDTGYCMLRSYLGQNIVTIFLFYSGFGIYESIKQKGVDYIKTIPVKRILITWINFVFAILLFMLMNFCLGIRPQNRTCLLAFTGWTSIGNSNWYIFAIISFYIITWLSFTIFHKYHLPALVSITLLIGIYVLILYKVRPDEGWWYNTAFCFAAGLWYSFFKEKIERLFHEKYFLYYIALLLSVLGVLIGKPYTYHLEVYELWTLCFTAMIVLLTMKISIQNPILHWIGEHTFEIYILQRIPMIILKTFQINEYPYLFGVLSLMLIFPLSYTFSKFLKWIDRKILNCFLCHMMPFGKRPG